MDLSTMSHPVIITAASYSVFFIILKSSPIFSYLSYGPRIDACSRIPSFVNIGVCIFSAWVLSEDFHEAFWNLEAAAFDSTGSRDYYLHLCTGYMLYDLGLMIFTLKELGDTAMIVHHLVVITALQLGVLYQAGTFYMTVLFFNEISSIFVNFRFLLLHHGMGDSQLYFWNGVALTATFFLVRIVTIGVLLVHVACSWWFVAWGKRLWWTRPHADRYLFGGLTLLLIVHGSLNLFWFWKITQHVRRASNRERERKVTTKKRI